MYTFKNIADFKNEMKTNTELQTAFKDNPVKATEQLNTLPSSLPDTWIYRIVVGSFGLSIILVIIATVILIINKAGGDSSVPTIFTAIASGAIGALAGLLAPSPARSDNK